MRDRKRFHGQFSCLDDAERLVFEQAGEAGQVAPELKAISDFSIDIDCPSIPRFSGLEFARCLTEDGQLNVSLNGARQISLFLQDTSSF